MQRKATDLVDAGAAVGGIRRQVLDLHSHFQSMKWRTSDKR